MSSTYIILGLAGTKSIIKELNENEYDRCNSLICPNGDGYHAGSYVLCPNCGECGYMISGDFGEMSCSNCGYTNN